MPAAFVCTQKTIQGSHSILFRISLHEMHFLYRVYLFYYEFVPRKCNIKILKKQHNRQAPSHKLDYRGGVSYRKKECPDPSRYPLPRSSKYHAGSVRAEQ